MTDLDKGRIDFIDPTQSHFRQTRHPYPGMLHMNTGRFVPSDSEVLRVAMDSIAYIAANPAKPQNALDAIARIAADALAAVNR